MTTSTALTKVTVWHLGENQSGTANLHAMRIDTPTVLPLVHTVHSTLLLLETTIWVTFRHILCNMEGCDTEVLARGE